MERYRSLEKVLKRNTRDNQLFPRYLTAYGIRYAAANLRDVDGTEITLYTIYDVTEKEMEQARAAAAEQAARER